MAETKAAPAKAKPEVDPWEEKEQIIIPRMQGVKEQPDVTVSVNGRVFRIQRGVHVDVPKPIAEVINRSIADQQKAEDFYLGRATG